MKRVLTGDRPTGCLHLGHYVGSLRERVVLQKNHDQFVMIADIQALTDNADNVQKIRDSILDVMLDYLAVGIDPEKTTIFVQSKVIALAELTVHLMNLVSMERVGRNPTVKAEIHERGYESNVTAGFFMYPVSQAADILAFDTDIVPAGADQKPMIELSNELAKRFNSLFGENILRTAEARIPEFGRLPGLDGQAKMGKSLGNAVYLTDPPEVVRKKCRTMRSDPSHVRIEDAGKLEGNVVFTYLDAFHPDKETISELKRQYTAGGVGDGGLKKLVAETLIELLEPIQERRRILESDKGELLRMLKAGTERAEDVANATLRRVRSAMGINYF